MSARQVWRRLATDPLRFDRSDMLALQVMLVGAVVGTAVATFGLQLLAWVRGEAVTAGYVHDVTVKGLPAEGVSVQQPADLVLVLTSPSVGDRLLGLLPGVLATALVLTVVVLLLRVLGDLAHDDPFRPANVTRLRVVAMVAGLGAALHSLLCVLVDAELLRGHLPDGLPLVATWSLPVLGLVAMTVIAAIAEAFKAGSRLRDDVDGLI